MISLRMKFIIAAVISTIGSTLAIIPALTKDHFELLLPGIILVIMSAPPMYYWRARLQSSTNHARSEREILKQAKQEAQVSKKE